MLFAAIFLALPAHAQTAPAASGTTIARALYDQGKFQDALENMLSTGLSSADDYYNTGNCFFKLGKLGQALAYYEKARSLDPRNDDIAYNLGLTEEALSKAEGFSKDASLWAGWFVPKAKAIPLYVFEFIIALAAIAIAWLAHAAKRKGLRLKAVALQPALIMAVVLFTLAGSLWTAVTIARGVRLASVVADSGSVRSGPNATFTELQKIAPGTHVELTGESRDGWQQIRFSLGNVGWIMEKDVLEL